MLEPDKVRELLADRRLKVVAAEIGVSYGTLYRFVAGKGGLSVPTIQKLSEYFEGQARQVRR